MDLKNLLKSISKPFEKFVTAHKTSTVVLVSFIVSILLAFVTIGIYEGLSIVIPYLWDQFNMESLMTSIDNVIKNTLSDFFLTTLISINQYNLRHSYDYNAAFLSD